MFKTVKDYFQTQREIAKQLVIINNNLQIIQVQLAPLTRCVTGDENQRIKVQEV